MKIWQYIQSEYIFSDVRWSSCVFPPFRLKLLEITAGVDGFMVYDLNLVEPMQKVSADTYKALYSYKVTVIGKCESVWQFFIFSSSSRATPKEITSLTSSEMTWLYFLKTCYPCLQLVVALSELQNTPQTFNSNITVSITFNWLKYIRF